MVEVVVVMGVVGVKLKSRSFKIIFGIQQIFENIPETEKNVADEKSN